MSFDPLSTDKFAASRFAPHGTVQILPEGELVVYQVQGPFNVEAMKAFGKTVAAMLANWKPVKPHASLSFWSGSMMASPDALATYEKILKTGRALYPKEVTNVWYVPPDIEGLRIMCPRWQALYEGAGYVLEIVHDEAEARARVRRRLLEAGDAAH